MFGQFANGLMCGLAIGCAVVIGVVKMWNRDSDTCRAAYSEQVKRYLELAANL